MERLGKYELREVLGRGGMGVVYRAFDPLMDREVAIKVILEKTLEAQETKARFLREARTAGKLSHENITVIHDFGEVEGKTYIVMEYLPGKDLRSIIDGKEALPLREKLNYARQICRGLQYAHSNMIVHRDIKPENIKVLADGRIKIMDFGIAKPYLAAAVAMEVETEPVLTRIGMRIGTPWYMSPEQVKGDPVDKRADIFSFGVVFYELLTYKKPFTGNDTTVMYKILHEQPDPIQLEESGLTTDLQRVLSRCLEKDPADRYPDCLLVLRDVEAILDRVSQTRNIKKLLTEGERLSEQRRFEEATVKFNEVLDLDPDNEIAKFSIRKLSEEHKESSTLRVLTGNIVGEVIAHFQILEKIGGGGMGVVYKAEDLTLKRLVALKFLPPDRTRDPVAKKRFLKEAQAASSLDHPNICAIHEISETEDGLIFICMAYYGGENLSKKILAGPLELNVALDIVVRIARGLAKAHEHGIVHRDIKPANIIITNDGQVKIVDFGLAKLSGATRITRIGSAMGTVPFMSPEQVKGLDQDHRTDIWSLGVLLYEVLTGKLPFMGEHETAVMYSIVNEEPALLTQVRPGLPAGLDVLIARALKKEPNERFESMREMLEALEVIQGDVGRPKALGLARSAELTRLVENGEIYFKRKEYGEALSRFEAALKLAPDDARVLQLRDESARKAAAADQIDAFVLQARSLVAKGKLRDARLILLEVAELKPHYTEAADLLKEVQRRIEQEEERDKLAADAAFYIKHQKLAEAEQCYRRLLEIDPENKDAQRGLKRVERERSHETKREKAVTPVPRVQAARRKRVYLLAASAIFLLGAGVVTMMLMSGPTDLAGQPERTGTQAGADSTGMVAIARQGMLNRKGLAAEAKAEQFAGDTYRTALTTEQEGDAALARGHFITARDSYGRAESLFADAISEAKRNEAAAASTLGELRSLVMNARTEMLADKSAADRAASRTFAPGPYREASDLERRGERLVKSDRREDLLTARDDFANARMAYRKALSDAGALAQLKKDADSQRSEMSRAKQGLQGADREKQASTSYRAALSAEAEGNRMYASNDYRGARDAFTKAVNLFASSAGEIATAREKAQPIAEAPKREAELKAVPAKEKTDREGARNEIQRMLDLYRETLEQGDLSGLTGLLSLPGDRQNEWSAFFGASEDRKVSIDNIEMDLGGENARVSFKVKMSFFNKAANTTQRVENARLWSLAPVDGKWKVVSQK
ncbi:MAG: protein kinase [Bacteroidota bacterium]